MTDLNKLIQSTEENLAGMKKLVASQQAQANIPQFPTKSIMAVTALGVIQRALSKEDCDYMVQHIMDGAQGFNQFLNSKAIIPLVQMIHDEYRSFLRGDTK